MFLHNRIEFNISGGGFIVNNLKKYSKGILAVALVVTSLVTGTVLNHFVKADNAIQYDI